MELRRVPLPALDLSLARLRQVPEAAVQEKMASLRAKGQLSPVVAADQGGTLVLVDGFVRHLAAVRLGLSSLLVEVVEVSAVQMKAQLYLRNRERGFALLEECRLVRELVDHDGLSQVEVGDLLERHKSWVCRRYALLGQLSPHLVEDAGLGLLAAGSLRRLAQLPARNQEELVAVVGRERLGPRDAAAVIDLWRRAPEAEARRYVLDHPREALHRVRGGGCEAAVDPRLGAAGRELLLGLSALGQVSLRVRRRMQEGLGELAPEGVQVLAAAVRQAEEQCTAALRAVQGWLRRGQETSP
jgi:ParB-like chromosome segregation protein Spo0J